MREATGHRRARPAAILLAVAIAATGSLVLPATSPGPAEAAVPAPGPGRAIVQLYVGDLRSGDGIGPLDGVTFGLFAAPPPASIVTTASDYGFVDTTSPDYVPPLFTCVSDSGGDCVFAREDGGVLIRPGAAGSDGVPQGTRLWAAAIGEATGDYFANPWWQTAPLFNTSHVSFRHAFQTPALVGDRSYLAGRDWITDPALATSPATPSVPSSGVTEATRRLASGGVTPLSRVNVPFVEQCGMNVAMIVDVSSSIGSSGVQGDLVDVMDAFVESLRGTPSSVALLSFGTDSPATGFPPDSGLRSVATVAEAEEFKDLYSSWATRSPWPVNYTNWDRGFAAAAAANGAPGSATHYDLALFITDGNPTVYGAEPLTQGGALKDPRSGYTRFRELGNGLASANLLKSQGTRVLAVGVGAGLTAEGAVYNLRTISGRDAYTEVEPPPPGETNDLLEADYIHTPDWGDAAQAMRDLVIESCAPTISVVKRIVPFGGDVDDAYLPPTGWGFAATTETPEVAIAPGSGTTDLATGGISFGVEFGDPSQPPAEVRIEEDLAAQPGYTALPEETACVERSSGTDVPVEATPDSGAPETAFSVPLGIEEMVTCVVYNMAPPEAEPAEVVVHKIWEIHTAQSVQTVPDGGQPVGLSAELELTGPDSDDWSAQPWAVPRIGYDVQESSPLTPLNSVSIRETATIAPELTECSLSSGGPEIKEGDPEEPAGYAPLPSEGLLDEPLTAGANEWTVRNTVNCASRLTLLKDVTNGPLVGEPELWTLAALDGPAGVPGIPASFDGASGSPEVTAVEVVPDAAYQLAESIPAPVPDHYMEHYRQQDLRAQPLAFPDSSGSWDCHPLGNPTGDPSLGAQGAVVVPLGMHYECIAANTTSLLTVEKTVEGGSASPADFTFRVEALPPVLIPDPLVHDFGSGVEQSVVPDQRYRLTEVDGPAGYELTELDCSSGGAPVDPDELVLLAGASASCAATNAFVPPGPDPDPDPDVPGVAVTGAEVPVWAVVAAVLAVLLGVIAGILVRRRRGRGDSPGDGG